MASVWRITVVSEKLRGTSRNFSSCSVKRAHTLHFNPFTLKSDQCKNSPAASPEILHHIVWRTWLFIAYSDEKKNLLQILATSLIQLLFKRLGEHRSGRVDAN